MDGLGDGLGELVAAEGLGKVVAAEGLGELDGGLDDELGELDDELGELVATAGVHFSSHHLFGGTRRDRWNPDAPPFRGMLGIPHTGCGTARAITKGMIEENLMLGERWAR